MRTEVQKMKSMDLTADECISLIETAERQILRIAERDAKKNVASYELSMALNDALRAIGVYHIGFLYDTQSHKMYLSDKGSIFYEPKCVKVELKD